MYEFIKGVTRFCKWVTQGAGFWNFIYWRSPYDVIAIRVASIILGLLSMGFIQLSIDYATLLWEDDQCARLATIQTVFLTV